MPLIEHPSEIFLSQLEEASVKLILLHDKTVVSACLSCLGSVVNNVTRNFTLIRDCFKKYFGHLISFKKVHEKDPTDPRLVKATPFFRRSLFTVGLLLRYFDFTMEELYTGLEWGSETKMAVFEAIFYFMDHESESIQNATLQALGSVCIRHYDLMMYEKLKQRYILILTSHQSSTCQRIQKDTPHVMQVLNNIEIFLSQEEVRMQEQDKKWAEYADKENLKEMNDKESGMASTVIQIFLQSVLDSFIHQSVQVRHAALKVIQLILAQGLVHPIQIVPYLICMSTDSEQRVSHTADKELQDIEKKYPGFIHMKLMRGVRLSYKLQEVLISQKDSQGGVLRGFRTKEGELPAALNGFLYSILRSTKSQRRAILLNLLKQFEESGKNPLQMLLYLADNLAYIPYTVIDEPLFLVHHIDMMVSSTGNDILQAIKESLTLPPEYEVKVNQETGKEEVIYDEDLDDDADSVLSRLPTDMRQFVDHMRSAQGCLLLLVLREHLKEHYGVNEVKIQAYSPSESQKIYEKSVTRKNCGKFNPRATVEILKLGETDPDSLDEQQRKDLVDKYLGFKDLMNKIEKDEEEFDEDGNPILQGTELNARDLQNMGMPTRTAPQHNGFTAPPPPLANLPPDLKGRNPEAFNPVIRIQNTPLSSLPSNLLPPEVVASHTRVSNSTSADPGPDSGGYLDPETGDWVAESKRSSRSSRMVSPVNSSSRENTPLKSSRHNTQESQKVPKLTINIGAKKPPAEHSFFAELDKSSKERDQRRNKKHHKEKHKEKHKKKKKKKRYQSDSGDSDSESDVECMS